MRPKFHVGLEVRRTRRRGAGLFLTESVASGNRILTFGGARLTRAAYEALDDYEHCVQIAPDGFLGPSGDLDDYTNHSCEPSTRVEVTTGAARARLIALFDLQPGDEITFDYSSVQWRDSRFVIESCRCGAPGCRGVIGDFTDLRPDERQRLLARAVCPGWLVAASRDG